ncbi:MAG TPA: hypothetical protein IAB45_00345 [Candidatus Onthousia faecavium]|nr:hypothetical protein [Candidatus Onthousia faecavium]
MINKKIGLLQIFSLTFFLTISNFILFFNNIIKISNSDTIISLVIGIIIDIIIFTGILKVRKSIKIHNKVLNIFLSIILGGYFLYLLINCTNFIKDTFLASGNFYSILVLLVLMSLIVSNKSYKEITSLSLILLFIFIPLFLFNIIGSSFSLDLSYLKPPFINSALTIIKGSLLFVIYTILPLLLLLFIPYQEIDQRKKQDKYLYLALISGLLVIIISYLILYFSSSINIITSYKYPFMLIINTLASFISFGRLSYLISFYLLFSLVITLSYIISIIKQLIGYKNNLKSPN